MFEEILGLPLHPLAVHAPIVLVPLLVVAAVVYALVPKKRGHLAWVAALLAIVAPVSAVVAKLSGDAFVDRSYQGQLVEPVATHADWGNLLMWLAIALGAITLALIAVRRGGAASSGPRGWIAGALTVALLLTAAGVGWLVFQTGHTGAEMVWQNR